MTRAAIYARVSTDEQAHSAESQESEGRRFAERKGWSVVAVYKDVGVSGAEFAGRPGLTRLVDEVKANHRPWDVLLVRDIDRIGRDGPRTQLAVEAILDTGAQLFTYSTEQEVKSDPVTRAMLAMAGAFAEMERALIASRTREGHLVRARKGFVVGGAVYGYRNRREADGVHYEVVPEQAEVVREIFARYAAGESLRAIAHDLNARGIRSPRVRVRGTGSWAPSCLGAIVHREIYRGVLIWGRKGSTYRGGTHVTVRRPETAWVRAEAPELRIIDEQTWQAARAREARHVQTTGTRRAGPPPRHLLSGIARCALCGGPMQVSNTNSGSGATRKIVRAYHCGWARDRGDTVCTNKIRRPVDELNDAVVGWLRDYFLSEDHIAQILAHLRRLVEERAQATSGSGEALDVELRRLRAEMARIAAAIATTEAAPEALTTLLVEKEARAKQVAGQLAVTRRAPGSAMSWGEWEAKARSRLRDLRGAFDRNPGEARAALQTVLRGPIQCAPVRVEGRPRFRLTGELAPLREAEPVKQLATPTGSTLFDGLLPDGLPGVPFALVAGSRSTG